MVRPLLYARILFELARYDVLFACRGMRGVRPRRRAEPPAVDAGDRTWETAVCEGLKSVAPFYWKPIRCLQRSIVTSRLLRQHNIPAEVVIGYRAAPFFSHAWVEVAGRVVNDSRTYQLRLQVLDRL